MNPATIIRTNDFKTLKEQHDTLSFLYSLGYSFSNKTKEAALQFFGETNGKLDYSCLVVYLNIKSIGGDVLDYNSDTVLKLSEFLAIIIQNERLVADVDDFGDFKVEVIDGNSYMTFTGNIVGTLHKKDYERLAEFLLAHK